MAVNDLVTKILPAYPFIQYRDDPNVVAFFNAYNAIAQGYLDYFNKLNMPYWPSTEITGPLLDWVAKGIYGEGRPYLQIAEETVAVGVYDTTEYDTVEYDGLHRYTPGSTDYIPDDYFKRVLTWNFYKGDGSHFSINWLKRRIARFIHGENGIDPLIEHTYDVSVTVNAGIFTIKIPDYGNGVGVFLKNAIDQGLLKLPFIYSYSTEVVNQ